MQERQTKQKTVIYDALCTLNHPTATEVYAWLQQTCPTISRATVFRVLAGFTSSGRAVEVRLAGNEVRYDFNVEPHYHARCVCCGRLSDVVVQGLPRGGLEATAYDGFEVQGYAVEFYGECKECKQ